MTVLGCCSFTEVLSFSHNVIIYLVPSANFCCRKGYEEDIYSRWKISGVENKGNSLKIRQFYCFSKVNCYQVIYLRSLSVI